MAYPLIMSFLLATYLLLCLTVCYRPVLQYLFHHKMCRKNYKGKSIPVGVGMMIPISYLFGFPWSWVFDLFLLFAFQFIGLCVITYAGWRDDRWGGNEAKGLKGHLHYWFTTGKISTGLWKALAGIGVSLIVSTLWSENVIEFFLHLLLMILFTNLINLLDLRPGRALKGFYLFFGFFLAYSFSSIPLVLWLPALVAALFLFPYDLRGDMMLGDTGSNGLGFLLGFWIVLFAPFSIKIVVVLVALFLHIYAEYRSITLFIQSNRFFQWLDMLGREKA